MVKIKVKAPFFDDRGIHKTGEICEVVNFRPEYMELIQDEKTEAKNEKADPVISDEVIESKIEEKNKKIENADQVKKGKRTRKKG